MDDLIRRRDVIDALYEVCNRDDREYFSISQMNAIDDIPAVDAVEVVHSWWRQNDNGTWSCSECSSWIPDEQHYYARFCLHCGARMDGRREDGDNGKHL